MVTEKPPRPLLAPSRRNLARELESLALALLFVLSLGLFYDFADDGRHCRRVSALLRPQPIGRVRFKVDVEVVPLGRLIRVL